jgi:hypothetical protein
MAMIPMECPKCGRWGSVPSNRLYVKLNCKKCQAPFYMNSEGDAILGEPPADKVPHGKDAKAERKAKEKRESVDLIERFRDISPAERNKLAIGVGAVVVLCAGLVAYARMPKGDVIRERALYVGAAIADGDRDRVKAASMPNTAGDVDKLFDVIAPKGSTPGHASDYQISADYSGGDPRQGAVGLMVTLMPRLPPGANIGSAPDPRASKPKDGAAPTGLQMIMLQMQFVRDPNSNWRLDATTTLENAKSRTRGRATASSK